MRYIDDFRSRGHFEIGIEQQCKRHRRSVCDDLARATLEHSLPRSTTELRRQLQLKRSATTLCDDDTGEQCVIDGDVIPQHSRESGQKFVFLRARFGCEPTQLYLVMHAFGSNAHVAEPDNGSYCRQHPGSHAEKLPRCRRALASYSKY